MAGALPPSVAPRSRIPALDAARGLGVVAMVVGHTLDALLSLAAREHPIVVAYWKGRGLTAPLFLAAAGWGVTVAIRRSGATGWEVVRGRTPRVLLLLAVGYALGWPGWGVELLRAGDPATWTQLLAFGPLHTIAVSIVAAALVLGLPWTAREKALALAALAVLAVALGMAAPAPFPAQAVSARAPVAIGLAQAVGGTSPFPLFPWAAYFLVGALVGLLAGDDARRGARGVALAGVTMLAATCWTGVGTMPPGHPVLFVFRSGAVLLVLAALAAVPAAAAARVAPLGRISLTVFAIHIPVVYGWSTHEGLSARIGPVLPPETALGMAAAVLAGSLVASFALSAVLRILRGTVLQTGVELASALLRRTRRAGEG